MTDSAISTRDLRKSFKKTEVLKGMSFDVRCGEIFALLGSNGAGKTTTIKIPATLLRPDSGTSSVSGFDVARSPDKVGQSISLTGQFTAVDEILTGRENLHMIARLRHLPDPGGIAEGLLERLGLTGAADRSAGIYLGRLGTPPPLAVVMF